MTRQMSLIALALAAAPAHAKTDVTPYLEVAQIVAADLNNGGDVLTYSSVAAGVEAQVETRRTQAQIAYRYERRIAWDDDTNDGDSHTGLARVGTELARGLTIEGGALATRARNDIRGKAPGIIIGDQDNITQVYSAYAGPTYSRNVGELEVGAAYRLGYTKVEAESPVLAAGQPRIDNYDDSTQHLATASVGMKSGTLPFGWTVSGSYEREDAGQLDQRFDAKDVRADVVVPVSPTLAVVGGVGYEDIEASQRAPLVDGAGVPITDGNGRFVTDPASPRLLAYDQDGLYWDVGVLWRPSRRTELEARVGRRYGTMSYTGSLTYQANDNTGYGIAVYDEVQTFGQLLTDNLALLPTAFQSDSNPFNPQFGGCVFGTSGNAGGCLNPAFQSINSSVFRTRGVTGVASTQRGPWNWGLGVGYAQRKYKTPVIAGTFNLNGLTDESWFAQGQVGYQIDPRSAVDGAVFASLFDPGIAGANDVLSTGATAAYQRQFGPRLSGIATVGLFSNKIEGEEGDLTASALLGMRLVF